MPYADLARRGLRSLEPLAAHAFFVAEVASAFDAHGLNMAEAYFTARAAPMGRVHPSVVHATFYTFNPKLVQRFTVFDRLSPEDAIKARQQGAGLALRRLLDGFDGDLDGVAAELRAAVEACPPHGRPLFAGHQAVPWPDDVYEAVWHGANCLREFRGDGHIALLVHHGIAGLEAQVLHAGLLKMDSPTETFLVRGHGWKPEAFADAAARLAERGLAEPDGTVTDAGLKLRAMIEKDTDHASEAPWRALGEDRAAALLEVCAELSKRCLTDSSIPQLASATQ